MCYRFSRLTVLAVCVVQLAACDVSVPSGVFSCAKGERCPPGQRCHADNLCRVGSAAADAAADSGDVDEDAGAEAGSGGRAGSSESNSGRGGSAAGSGGVNAGGEGGRGGEGGSGGASGQGGGGASGQGSGSTFHVRSSVPASDSPLLEDLGAALKITFSNPVDPSSLTDESFSLTRDTQRVAGKLNVASTELRFEPDLPWTLAAAYELRLTAAVKDNAGRALEPLSFAWKTREGRWQREMRANGTNVHIAVSGDGHAFLAWAQVSSMTYNDIWSSQFTPPSGWSSPLLVRAADSVGPFLSAVFTNRRHRAGVAFNTISANVSVVPFTTGPSWGTSVYLGGPSSQDQFLLNESDEVITAIDKPTGLTGHRFTLGAINSAGMSLDSSDGGMGRDHDPSVALLGSSPGDTRVIWEYDTTGSGGPREIYTASFEGYSGTRISAAGVNAANSLLIGDPRQQSLIALWQQADPSWVNIWAVRVVKGADWSAPTKISDDMTSSTDPALAIDPTGRALAVWRQSSGISSAVFTPGSGWSAPKRITAEGVMNADKPRVVMDAAGNGLAAWTQDGPDMSLNEVWVARYLRGQGWVAAQRISDAEAGAEDRIGLGCDDYGRALVVWIQANQVWSSRFD